MPNTCKKCLNLIEIWEAILDSDKNLVNIYFDV